MATRPIFSSRISLLVAMSLIAGLLVGVFWVTYNSVKSALVQQERKNQEKLTSIFSHSLSEYFHKMKLVTEYAATSPAFAHTPKNRKIDSTRYEVFWGDTNALMAAKSLDSVLTAPDTGDTKSKNRRPRVWQVFRGLPELDPAGDFYAKDRRIMARTARTAFPDLHYVFEMDANGDMIFLEPFKEQQQISSFNYKFRDYFTQVKLRRGTILSEGYISRDKFGTQIITVATPIFHGDSIVKRKYVLHENA